MIFCTVANMLVISKNAVKGYSLSMNTPSLESTAEVMTTVNQCCDLAHISDQAIKNPAQALKKTKSPYGVEAWKAEN